MRVVLHADASPTMGTGHVMRCIALGAALAEEGDEVILAAVELLGDLAVRAKEHGIRVVQRRSAPRNVDWIVVDGYHLDGHARRELGPPNVPRLVVSDFGGEPEDATLVLNQNLYARPTGPTRAAGGAELLAGPAYALLRPEFAAGPIEREQPARADRILVTMGGADPDNATAVVVAGLAGIDPAPAVRIVIGTANPHRDEVARQAVAAGFEVAVAPGSLADHLAWADLVVSACGTSVLEIARYGRPLVGVVLAENQVAVAAAVEAEGLGAIAGRHPTLGPPAVAAAVERMRADAPARTAAAAAGPRLVDGRGASRVARVLRTGPLLLRDATLGDADRLLEWRRDPAAMAASFDRRPIDPAEHRRWLAARLATPETPTWIGTLAGQPVGVVRFAVEGATATISVVVDPAHRASGAGLRLISAGCARLGATFPDVEVDAWIRHGNPASETAFQRAGFRLSEDLDDRRRYRLPPASMG